MIGHYVHHHGSGHLTRARALAHRLDVEVTGLSSLPRPADWDGPWLRLPRDDDEPPHRGVTAGGRLHWAPLHHRGHTARMARVSRWIEECEPEAVVVDVSVELVVLCRLHGVPVVGVVLPGRRDDPAHLLGFDLADALVGFWPDGPDRTTDALLPGVPAQVRDRVRAVGAMARYPVAAPSTARPRADRSRADQPRVTVLLGSGGDELGADRLDALRTQAPGWAWTVLGGGHAWVPDPRRAIAEADVVVTHAGQNALAEVAALRRPAVVVPQSRPFAEQRCTGALLAGGPWPATVLDRPPARGWARVLEDSARLDGERWATWCDGGAAQRFAGVVDEVRGG